jgi:hypothetical protein
VPVWVAGDSNIPAILAADSSGNAPLCEKALALKDKCFPIKRGSGYKYLNTAAVVNTEGTGILQLLRPVENEIMSMAEKQIKKWRETGKINSEEAGEFYRWTEKFVTNKYLNLFGL